MKKIFCYLSLLLISTACTANPINLSSKVTSWETVEPDRLNSEIQQAHKSSFEWAAKPELYVFNLFEISDLRKLLYEYNADNIESPHEITITIVRDGFLDDSVRGDIQKLNLVKNDKGIWEVLTIKRSISCWRRQKPLFSSEACP